MRNTAANISSETLQTRNEIIQMDQDYSSDTKMDISVKKENLGNRIIQTVVDLIVIICIFIVFGLVYVLQSPKIQYFTCDDTDIFFPYKPDTIPFWAVGIFATIGPILFIIPIELMNARLLPFQTRKKDHPIRTFLICTFHALSLFILGISLTLCLTEIGKRWIGRLRPYFIAKCQPNLNALNCTTATLNGFIYNPIYTGGSFCTNTVGIDEARLSFPSGHSSYSWYCMTFLIFYIEARLFLVRFRYLKPLIQMTAFIAAYVTCMSRVSDYHHRGSDVIGGGVLGILIALFVIYIVGKVLWLYEIDSPQYPEIDLKPVKPKK